MGRASREELELVADEQGLPTVDALVHSSENGRSRWLALGSSSRCGRNLVIRPAIKARNHTLNNREEFC